MTYEENVNKLLEIAGDYSSIVANHALENSMYTAAKKELFEELEKYIGSLSVGDCNIRFSKDRFVILSSNQWDAASARGYLAILEAIRHPDSLAAFRKFIQTLAFDTIHRLTSNLNITLPDISRFASYANMAVTSIDEDFVERIKEIFKKGSDISKALKEENTNYSKYVQDVSRALSAVSYRWFRETTLVPGMKIGVVNLKSDALSTRTIKKITRTEDTIRITTKESSAIISNIDRIDIASTWFLNAKEHTDIAKAIKWKRIEQFI